MVLNPGTNVEIWCLICQPQNSKEWEIIHKNSFILKKKSSQFQIWFDIDLKIFLPEMIDSNSDEILFKDENFLNNLRPDQSFRKYDKILAWKYLL